MSAPSMGHDSSLTIRRHNWVRRTAALGLIVLALLCVWFLSSVQTLQLVSLSAASALLILLGRECAAWIIAKRHDEMTLKTLKSLLQDDFVPALICDDEGCVLWSNTASDEAYGPPETAETTLPKVLSDHLTFADPVLRRLREAARHTGSASETVVGLDVVLRLHLRRVGAINVWRIETKDGEREDTELSVPSVLLGRNGVILSMNEAARSLVGTRAKSTASLFRNGSLPQDGPVPLMTTRGEILVHARTRKTGAGRTRVLLSPVDDPARAANTSLEDLPLPAARISPKGKLLEVNELAASLLKCPQGDRSLDLGDVLDGLQYPIDQMLERAVLEGGEFGPDILNVRRAEAETYVQMTLKRVIHNETVSLVAIMSDATELKTLEAQFVQGQKMQAIGQLAGGVAHDFNNLLTAISGHCDLMLLRHDQGDQDYADLIQIHQNANRAAALVTQLLAFSRKQTLQPEYLDLRDTLSDLTHLLNRLVGEKVSLLLSHDPVLRPIRGDRRQLEQVIMNLVVNARDAMPDGGQITIETESLTLKEPLKRDRVSVSPGDYVVVRVRDQGTGIHADVVQKIFEPFFTTKRTGEGTGLGLSTAYGIVKQTGGYIFVDSQVGQGTCFTLLFAAQMPQSRTVTEVEPVKERPSYAPCEGVVLLVEDEPPVRAFASRALSMRGFEVLEAASAEEALTLLEDDALSVDIFVTDVVMPGEDGPTWVRKALQKRPNVRVVFVSGYTEGAFDGDAPDIPGSVFLPKPFSLGELTSTVQKQITG